MDAGDLNPDEVKSEGEKALNECTAAELELQQEIVGHVEVMKKLEAQNPERAAEMVTNEGGGYVE